MGAATDQRSQERAHSEHRQRARPVRTTLIVLAALLVGLLARSVAVDGTSSPLVSWLPWLQRTPVTFFFNDGDYLVPVSRTVDDVTPERLLDALLEGPAPDAGLTNPIPSGTTIREVRFEEGVLTVDLGGTYSSLATPKAHEAVLQSLRSWPDVETAEVTVDGNALETNTSGHLVYWYDEPRDRIVAEPTNLIRPADVLAAYLEGPRDPDLVGLPPEVQATGVDLGSNELLTLSFTFPDTLREFAVDHPESVRRVLEGLIATFNTGFSGVGGVYLDFEGHNALGLGQCANLLNTLQTMPEVLNDERVLSRHAEA